MKPRSMEWIRGWFEQQVGATKILWGRLIADELLQIEGEEQQLAGLGRQHDHGSVTITRPSALTKIR